MKDLIDRFNTFFEGDAMAEVTDDYLSITIDTRTIVIQLPSIVGGDATGEVPVEDSSGFEIPPPAECGETNVL